MKYDYAICKSILSCSILFFFSNVASAKTFQVGSTHTYMLPSQVSSLVQDGDTVAIDAGSYTDCTTWTKNNLVLKGVGGYAHLQNKSCGGKAIWIIQGNNTTVESIEFSGATVPDQNGAGIRQEGPNLTIRHCYFHDNEDGILAGDNANSNIFIEYSEFANNGYGDGYSHNMYINHVASFTIQYCYIHHAKVGHDIKSRAYRTYILYNRISDESDGSASRNIDLPNGGLAIIIGNVIQHGPQTQNSNVCEFGLEGLTNPIKNLYIVNNTFVNERSTGSFINVPSSGTDTIWMVNNIFAGAGALLIGKSVVFDTMTNLIRTSISQIGFTNFSVYDYHLLNSSPAINAGSDPGMINGFSLKPINEYVHPSNMKLRQLNGQIDIGAYEYIPPTNVQDNQMDLPYSMMLFQNYPNPFTSSTTITLTSSQRVFDPSLSHWERVSEGRVRVSLIIYDIFGREVLDLSNQINESGQVTMHNWQLPSQGIYFYQLRNGNEIHTRRMLLMNE